MKIKFEGVITEVTEYEAKVRLSEHSECAQCGSCSGNEASTIQALNPIHAKPGQQVIVEKEDRNMIQSAFIIFIFPLLSFCAGAGLGYGLSLLIATPGVLTSSAAGILLLFLSLFFIRKYDKKMQRIPETAVIVGLKT